MNSTTTLPKGILAAVVIADSVASRAATNVYSLSISLHPTWPQPAPATPERSQVPWLTFIMAVGVALISLAVLMRLFGDKKSNG